MLISRVSFFLLIFLSSVGFLQPVFSEANQQTELQEITEGQSAGDIFIESARVFFREEFEEEQDKKYKNMTEEEAFQQKMGTGWEDKIQEATKYWTSTDALVFLNYLFNRIGQKMTLSRIKSASYFRNISYSRFLERVEFYESYIGEDGVTYRLSKSLNGFQQGDIIEIQRVIEFLEEYLGSREILQKMMMKNLGIFSSLSSKEGAQTKLENVKDVIAYLRSIGIMEEQIKSMIINNFEGFVNATRRKIQTRIELLTQEETTGIAFIQEEINQMIIENIHGFLKANLTKVKAMVAYLKDIGLKDEQIKDMAKRDLLGFSTIKHYELRDMIETLKKNPQLNKVKKETLMKTIREMIADQNLVDFYYNFNANLKTLICTGALSN